MGHVSLGGGGLGVIIIEAPVIHVRSCATNET